MPHCLLSDRAVLAVCGADARDFLQGLISNDIRKVSAGRALFAALLSPQGKFLFDFFIVEYEGALLLETDKARLPQLQKRLLMYKLRAKIELAVMPEMQVSAGWGGEAARDGLITYADPRLAELGWRSIHKADASASSEMDAYERHRIGLGVPEGSKDLVADRSLLLEYGYDELNAIDFAKGCYVGQEVTARTKHRASLHKFIHIVEASKPLPSPGTPILCGPREVGVLCGSVGTLGLALLRVDEVARATPKTPLTCEGVPLQARLPHWCKTAFQAAL
jgi:folate-binding protein YgfZ